MPIHAHEGNPGPVATGAWQDRLIELARALRQGPAGGADALQSELWLLLHVKLRQHVRAQARRLGALSEEDIEDLASRKSLEILTRIDSGKWEAENASSAEVVRFVVSVARNGVIDHLRKQGRRPEAHSEEFTDHHVESTVGSRQPKETPDARMDRTQFARALVDCAGKLKSLHRTIWLFRAFYEMNSKQIAAHPEVVLEVGNVDVILQRTRNRMSDCLAARGMGPADLRPGAFTAAWMAFRLEALRHRGAPNEE